MPNVKASSNPSPQEKAKIQELKAQQAEYKRVAKLLKSKDLVKREEGLNAVSLDAKLLSASGCLLSLFESLVPVNKKTIELIKRAVSIAGKFVDGQTTHPDNDDQESVVESNVAFLVLDMAKAGDSFTQLDPIAALLLHGQQDLQLGAFRIISRLVQFLSAKAPSSQLVSNTKLIKAKQVFLRTINLAANITSLFSQRLATLMEAGAASTEQQEQQGPSSPEILSTLNELLTVLNFLAGEDYASLGRITTDENQGLSSILESLSIKELRDKASHFVEIVTGNVEALVRISELSAGSILAAALAAQSELIKSAVNAANNSGGSSRRLSAPSTTAPAPASAQEAPSASIKGGAKGATAAATTAKNTKAAAVSKKKEPPSPVVEAAPTPTAPPPTAALMKDNPASSTTLDPLLVVNSRLTEILIRLFLLKKNSSEIAGNVSNSIIPQDAVVSTIQTTIETFRLSMPWSTRSKFARTASQLLGVIASETEEARLLVRNAGGLDSLLNVIISSDMSPEALVVCRTAEKALHHLIISSVIGQVDEHILTGVSPSMDPAAAAVETSSSSSSSSCPYLSPDVLLAALASESTTTWQIALRLIGRLTTSERNTFRLVPAAVPRLVKIGEKLHTSLTVTSAQQEEEFEEKSGNGMADHIRFIPIKTLLSSLATTVHAIVGTCAPIGGNPADLGCEEMVAMLTNLLVAGPLQSTDFLISGSRKEVAWEQDTNYDAFFTMVPPEAWRWDLSGIITASEEDQDAAKHFQRVVPRAQVVRALTCIASMTTGIGPAAVVDKVIDPLLKLLMVDVDVEGSQRPWEKPLDKSEAFLHDELRLELLDLMAAVALAPNGRNKLLDAVKDFRPSWAPHSQTTTPPSPSSSSFKIWDVHPEDFQSLERSYPYLRVLAGVLSQLFDANTPTSLVDSAIQASYNLLWDKAMAEGAQELIVDNLAGSAMSMGIVVPLISYISRNRTSPKATMGRELIAYLVNRGRAREEYWANVPAYIPPPPMEETIATSKGKAPTKKMVAPEEEAKQKELAEMKCRGPTASQWKDFLEIPVRDTRTGKEGNPPMLALILAGENELLSQLVQAGAKPVFVDERGRTPLMNAILNGDDVIAQNLINLGADVNAFDHEGNTVLKCAFVSPDKDELRAKLDEIQSNIKNVDCIGGTGVPSSANVVPGQGRLVSCLLSKGADPNVSDGEGNFPLHWALMGTYLTAYTEGLEVTLTADIRTPSDSHLKENLVDILLDYGANVNVVNKAGTSPLSTAIKAGSSETALKILRKGANPNVLDADKHLAIHYAASVIGQGYDELMLALLAAGHGQAVIEGEYKDTRKGQTTQEKYVSHLSAILDEGLFEAALPSVVVQKLYTASELLSIKSDSGYTTFHYACGAGTFERLLSGFHEENINNRANLMKILVDNVQDINEPGGEDGDTALHLLARTSDSLLLFDVLLNGGANINVVDKKVLTPLNYALRNGHLAIAETLVTDPRMQVVVAMERENQYSRNAMVDACGLAHQTREEIVTNVVDRCLLTVDHDLLVLLLEKTIAVDPSLKTLNVSSSYDSNQVPPRQAHVDSSQYSSALCAAVNTGNIDAMDLLLSARAININIQDGPWRETPLHIACRRGDLKAVQLLETMRGDDLSSALRNSFEETPLYLAVSGNHIEITVALLGSTEVRHSILEEIDAIPRPAGSQRPVLPSSLELVESLNLNHGENDILLHIVLEAIGHQIPPSAHLHPCFARNISYKQFLAVGASNGARQSRGDKAYFKWSPTSSSLFSSS